MIDFLGSFYIIDSKRTMCRKKKRIPKWNRKNLENTVEAGTTCHVCAVDSGTLQYCGQLFCGKILAGWIYCTVCYFSDIADHYCTGSWNRNGTFFSDMDHLCGDGSPYDAWICCNFCKIGTDSGLWCDLWKYCLCRKSWNLSGKYLDKSASGRGQYAYPDDCTGSSSYHRDSWIPNATGFTGNEKLCTMDLPIGISVHL